MIASIIIFALTAMFSRDGVTPGSGLRECPSNGISLRTHEVVVGLHVLDDQARMECGWYRFVPTPQPDTNHYWRVTNYVFRTSAPDAGTVIPLWGEYSPEPIPVNYSKYAIIGRLEEMNAGNGHNKWDEVKAKLEEFGLMDKWNACTFISATDPIFLSIKPRFAEFMNMTEKQLDDWLSRCLY